MKKSYAKDILRSILNGKKRFLSIMVITILGVAMFSALKAACNDLYYSADTFFDDQKLFDIRIMSTLGLTEEDVEALKNLDEVVYAQGGYSENAYFLENGKRRSVEMRTLTEEMNLPSLLSGTLPEKSNEIAVTEKFCKSTGKKPGDTITLDGDSETLKSKTYCISGIVIDPMDINSPEGAMGFRSVAATDYVFFMTPEAVDSDYYTVVYLQLKGTKDLNSYSPEYENRVAAVIGTIESEIMGQRERLRYQKIVGDAMEEWLDGKREMEEEFAKAETEIADAKEELEDGRKELLDGERELREQEQTAKDEFTKARQEIEDGFVKLAEGEEELAAAKKQLLYGLYQLNLGKDELARKSKEAGEQFALAEAEFAKQEAVLKEGWAQYEEGIAPLHDAIDGIASGFTDFTAGLKDFGVEEYQMQPYETLEEGLSNLTNDITAMSDSLKNNPYIPQEALALLLDNIDSLLEACNAPELVGGIQAAAENKVALEEGQAQFDAAKADYLAQKAEAEKQLAQANFTIAQNEKELNEGFAKYDEGIAKLEENRRKLTDGLAELEAEEADAKQKIREGKQELAEGQQELLDGERELAENVQEYEEEKAKAEQELADAKQEIDDIDMTRWYVQDRSSLSGCSNIKNDAASIEAVGRVFPILFLTVAILISLTTITRMVEEERGLIGAYKALGFSNHEIRQKYLLYAAMACFFGGILGNAAGFFGLPAIIFVIFRTMYLLPEYSFYVDMMSGIRGMLVFEAAILIATWFACEKELIQMPAVLMRPKAPKAGSRVFLERIPFLWKRFSFLNKVTARNLFRYKKRLLMTIFGIMGCVALLLCGFTIKDTVAELLPQQYEVLYQYDFMAVATDEEYSHLKEKMQRDKEVAEYTEVRIESLKVTGMDGKEETVQLVALPEETALKSYIQILDLQGNSLEVNSGDIYLTQNVSEILGFAEGDSVFLKNTELVQAEVTVTKIVQNALGNVVYVNRDTYEKLFGKYQVNGVYAHFAEDCENRTDYTEGLAREKGILSTISTATMAEEFSQAFILMNMVVYVVIVMAAGLAFVVLFTLANTNISERTRELATIKVLGFYNREVHLYVNKETMILTGLGILLGMPAGRLLGSYVMGILKIPSIHFIPTLYPVSYLLAGIITLVFAILVELFTNPMLDHINMVEALKSVE